MGNRGDRLIQSAQQALEFAKGTANESEYRVHIPEQINVKHIRKNLKMSQIEFADCFGFNLRTLQDWEQGRRNPQGAAKNFLIVLEHEPEVVRRVLLRECLHLKEPSG